MKVKDEKGRILSSENPVIVGMWKKAGYTEVGVGSELPEDGEPLTNEEPQDEEPKKGRKKVQE